MGTAQGQFPMKTTYNWTAVEGHYPHDSAKSRRTNRILEARFARNGLGYEARGLEGPRKTAINPGSDVAR
jgi:hypothetical protein